MHWLEPLGVSVAWLTGSRKGKGAHADARARGRRARPALVVGTHAVIQDDVAFAGWAWRSSTSSTASASRSGWRCATSSSQQALEPHLLMMSATPIPRTLAMTYFADLT